MCDWPRVGEVQVKMYCLTPPEALSGPIPAGKCRTLYWNFPCIPWLGDGARALNLGSSRMKQYMLSSSATNECYPCHCSCPLRDIWSRVRQQSSCLYVKRHCCQIPRSHRVTTAMTRYRRRSEFSTVKIIGTFSQPL